MTSDRTDEMHSEADVKQGVFSSISNEINTIIQTFILQYESQHQVKVLHHYLDKNTIDGGASFASGVIQLNFCFSKNETRFRSSVLLKIPQMGSLYQHSLKMLCYQKELFVYKEVLPRMYAHWQGEKPFPTFYTNTDSGILILENLLESEFQTVKPTSLLDLASTRMVLMLLAQFHALSTAFVDEIGSDMDDLTVTNFGDSEIAEGFVAVLSSNFRKFVLPHVSSATRSAFEKFFENYKPIIELGCSPNTSGLNVILHGDAHLYNMLFRKDQQNQVEKCKFIDFQASRRGSPAIDLIFFLASSVQFEVFHQHRESLFDLYLREFRRTVEKMQTFPDKVDKCVEYNKNDLNCDLKKYKPYFLHILSFAPALRANQLKSDFKGQGDVFEFVLKSEEYISSFKSWVKCLELEDL